MRVLCVTILQDGPQCYLRKLYQTQDAAGNVLRHTNTHTYTQTTAPTAPTTQRLTEASKQVHLDPSAE